MKQRLKFFLYYTVFFMLYFAVARLIFIIYNYEFAKTADFSDILLSFLHGSRQDASVTAYFLAVPALLIVFTAYFDKRFLKNFITIYTILLLFIIAIIIVSDAELYRNWGFRTDATPLLYLETPKFAAASSNTGTYIKLSILFLTCLSTSIFIYLKYVGILLKALKKTNYKTSVLFLLITASLILPVRGSVGIAPMNNGTVYFSRKNIFVNHAAINVIWNVGFALSELNKFQKIKFFDDKKAELYFNSLYPVKNFDDDNSSILKNQRPNIVIIILESFTAKVSDAFGGKYNATPNLDKIAKKSIMFNNFYASGDRTVKGIVAVLSGYPSLPKTAIMNYSDKVEKLPTITQVLGKNHYNTEWICGFNTNFANINSYLIHNKFDKTITINDFPNTERNSKWGVHDHIVFNKLFEECKHDKKPYFKVFMTLSSHEPFDVPMKTVVKGNSEDSLFLNSVCYTDKSLGKFIDKMKTLKDWDNTLIILVADHGSRLPDKSPNYLSERFKIPMVWTGGAVKKDTIISKFAGQTDIFATLLSQINLPSDVFKFSKNLFSEKSKSFAFYDFNNGFGFITDTSVCVFDNNRNNYILTKNNDDKFGKAYLQILTEDFTSK